ncbi:MAG: Holliday junction branch migration protein RuvA [Dehalococcoidia bacterium]
MITGVRGVLEARGPDWVQVRVGGVLLQVYVPVTTTEELGLPGQQVELHTHLQVRDDTLVLYGFASPEGLHLFQMLTGVSGVGPRLALALLSAMRPEELAVTIAAGEVQNLSRVPGVGKRTAERIVLELSGRLAKEVAELPVAAGTGDGDVVAALMALGYSASEARQAAAAAGSPTDAALEERVRQALQRLGG